MIISRLLQHFPSRQTERDGVIAGDIAADCIHAGVTEAALRQACADIRRDATAENPYLPPSGEFVRRSVKIMTEAKNPLPKAAQPKPQPYRVNNYQPVPWACKSWPEFTEQDKIGLQKHLESMDPKRRDVYLHFLRVRASYPY